MEPGLDGVMQILEVDGDDVTVAIVNPDGSLAEMSGNGTRIAAAWLAEQTGAREITVRVGPRAAARPVCLASAVCGERFGRGRRGARD